MFSQVKKALRYPNRIIPFFRRVNRNRRLKSSGDNFIAFYAGVVDDDAVKVSPSRAIGSFTPEHWEEVGKKQFDYLTSHGLRGQDRFLDIGCGNLRLGSKLIPYLDAGNYTGIDISPRIVTAALETVKTHNIQDKLPRVFLVAETNYGFLPENYFDAAHAHSVFSHLPIGEIEKVLHETWRVLKPGGWFDFTFRNGEVIKDHLKEDFDYPAAKLLELSQKCGYQAKIMEDWVYSQDKIRAVKPGVSFCADESAG